MSRGAALLDRVTHWLFGAGTLLDHYQTAHDRRHEDDDRSEFLRRQAHVKHRLHRLEELMDTRTARQREDNDHGAN